MEYTNSFDSPNRACCKNKNVNQKYKLSEIKRLENSGYHKQFYILAEKIIMLQGFGKYIKLYLHYSGSDC